MKSKFAAFVMLLATVFVLASCLSNDDNYTFTDDSAITSFSISSGKQYVHVKSSTGADSVVTNELTLTSYKFYIDQVKCEIYNPDSLPCGTDVAKLLCTASSSNSGIITIKNISSDTLAYLSTTDSVDFSVDRQLQVYSNSGQAVRKYTVKVNVHKEFPDSFAWHAVPECEALKNLTAIRTVAATDGILLFGTNGEQTLVFKGGNAGWTLCTPDFNHVLSADCYRGVVEKAGRAYISDEGNIMSTTDGNTWKQEATATGITRLVAASSFRLYGYAADGRLMASSDNGATWAVSTVDDELSLLPTGETAYVRMPVATNKLTERVLLIGSRDKAQYPSDANLTVWGKVDEGASGSENQPWAYYNIGDDNTHRIPMLSSFSAYCYDGALFLLGHEDGKATAIYKSRDNGITWNTDTTIALPSGFGGATAAEALSDIPAMTVDSDNVLWLVNAKNGKAWRGRINRLGWKKEQTSFTE